MALPVNDSTHLIPAYYSFIDPERLKVECRTEKVSQSETDVLPLCHATNVDTGGPKEPRVKWSPLPQRKGQFWEGALCDASFRQNSLTTRLLPCTTLSAGVM